jgi:hypothetical protein
MKNRPLGHDHAEVRKALSSALLLSGVFLIGSAVGQTSGPQIAPLVRDSNSLMSEQHRASVSKIVVLPGLSPASGSVTGSYGKETLGLIDGIDKGLGMGRIGTDVGGIPISIPIPILAVPAAIFHGLSGGAKRELQDFRDALTADLAETAEMTLSNDALATDVFWRLREVPSLDPKVFDLSTPIPADTDAILYVSFSDSTIDVQESDALITMSATAALLRLSDGTHLYENQIHYQDKDTLQNWTKNNNAAWHDFANFARHYLGREISAELFERVYVKHDLRPQASSNVSQVKKNQWHAVTQSTMPTLAWQHTLDQDDAGAPWVPSVGAGDIVYEVEIYDLHQLVYAAKRITADEFTVDLELEPCKTYYWSVRPSYKIDGETRFGEWMRFNPDAANGNDGSAASVAAAYIYDFAKLEIDCGG